MQLISNLFLFFIAMSLAIIIIPIGIIVAGIYLMIKFDLELLYKYFSRLFYYTAFSIDKIGNYACAVLFNLTLLIKNESVYRFGKEGETISYALGKNYMSKNLNWLGRMLCRVLDLFEKDHVVKTIQREGYMQ